MRVALIMAILIAGATSVSADEVVYDFRGGKFDQNLFRFDGPGAQAFFTPGEKGLRLRYREDNLPLGHAGIVWKCDVSGDFTATVNYEVHENPRPPDGYGVGLELFLYLDTPPVEGEPHDGIPFVRLARPLEGLVFRFSHMTGRRTAKSVVQVPADPEKRRGRLQLTRQGPTLTAAFAEGDDGPWEELQRTDIGTMDILMVRFGGVGTNAPLDAHILEMQLQGPQVRFWDKPQGVPARQASWLLWAIGGAAGFFLILIVADRWRRSSAVPSPPMIGFRCGGCGKNLKVKHEEAGSRVRCPICGQVTLAPTFETGAS